MSTPATPTPAPAPAPAAAAPAAAPIPAPAPAPAPAAAAPAAAPTPAPAPAAAPAAARTPAAAPAPAATPVVAPARIPARTGASSFVFKNWVICSILLIGLILFLIFRPESKKEEVVSKVTQEKKVVMTESDFDKKIEEARTEERKKVEVERPTPPTPESYGVATFRPTTLLNEANSRNVPTITRTEQHVAPNGKFHLLFGVDPITKDERMITVGGSTVTLLEPDWKTTRPAGKLVLLAENPKGLRLPVGRHAVAIVAE